MIGNDFFIFHKFVLLSTSCLPPCPTDVPASLPETTGLGKNLKKYPGPYLHVE